MKFTFFLFVPLGNTESTAISQAKAGRGSGPAATIAVPPINNSRRVRLIILTLLFGFRQVTRQRCRSVRAADRSGPPGCLPTCRAPFARQCSPGEPALRTGE